MNIEEEWRAAYGGHPTPEDIAYLAEGNARQARKRVSADALIRDSAGRILLVDPTYKPDWDLPGGMAEANEAPRDALKRELREELGLEVPIGELLCVDWEPPHGPWDDLLAFVFDGGVLSIEQAASLRIRDPELRAVRFCTVGEAEGLLRPYVGRRVQAAVQALGGDGDRYLQDGLK
ncbi:NUDIX hydrolase [Frankia sp. Mgl5]|uniref:NUDIX domain-containing protein n=1 Tax=Frankia sp. Mgl5 TaxID=2933793 RepID=UPI00200FC63A|nr:NUDIX hydrolase [Frankia sp. Mgl5]MCK9928848.1 NUDIX hydrolase [Frankia sp. Mgl5]